MADPFLLTHRVDKFFFNISGNVTPISIRDQMIRGRMLVDRARDAGLINSRYPLLVVGAGAGGATAAIRAVQHKIPTTLIDVEPAPFRRQSLCRTRWVDPTQYDWPVSHWTQSIFPWGPPSMPFSWRKNYASYLAAQWTRELNRARKNNPSLLRVRFGTTIDRHWLSSSARSLKVKFDRSSRIYTFGCIISAKGFGSERCTVKKYSGFEFWETDDFESVHMGLTLGKKIRVLISGGGDGALQDFLRIITDEPEPVTYERSAKDLYERLKSSIDSVTSANLTQLKLNWAEIEAEVQSAEDQAQRAYIWCEGRHHDHSNYEKLHQVHREAIEKLWRLWHSSPDIWDAVRLEINSMLRAPIPDIKLAFPCTHFSRSYGLNRFLVLLFARFLDEEYRLTTLSPQTELLDIIGSGKHVCANDPRRCYGQDHEVKFRTSVFCASNSTCPVHKDPQAYNVIIIRHGVSAPTGAGIAFPRQILPYYAVS